MRDSYEINLEKTVSNMPCNVNDNINDIAVAMVTLSLFTMHERDVSATYLLRCYLEGTTSVLRLIGSLSGRLASNCSCQEDQSANMAALQLIATINCNIC